MVESGVKYTKRWDISYIGKCKKLSIRNNVCCYFASYLCQKNGTFPVPF